MTYTYEKEVDFTVGDKELTVTLLCDVKCTYAGHPGSGPSLSGPGEPAEGPEFETEDLYIQIGETKPIKLDIFQAHALFGEDFCNEFDEEAIEAAGENSSDSDYEPDDYRDYED